MTAMTMRAVPDGNGGFRHVPTPFVPVVVGGKGKKKSVRPPDPIVTNGESAAEQLRLLIERHERLQEEKAGIVDDIRDVESEMKSLGYNVPVARAIMRMRKQEKHVRDEWDGELETYKVALGLA